MLHKDLNKNVLNRENSKYDDPEVRIGLTSLKNRKFGMIALYVGNEAKKAVIARLCRAFYTVRIYILKFTLYLHYKNHSLVCLIQLVNISARC